MIGAPVPGGMGYQPAVTAVAHDMHWLSHMVHGIMVVIVLFVTALLLIVIVRFNSRRNPTPASFTHNTRIEIAWTLIPVVILIVIGSFSLPILFKQLERADAGPDGQGDRQPVVLDLQLSGERLHLRQPDARAGRSRGATAIAPEDHLLAADNALVVPVDKVVHVLVAGADVIHSFTVPAFGIKIDAVPGRLNETWFQAEQEGIYFGQCSELCGKNHSYMPITVKVVSQEAYDAWLDWAIDEYGGTRPEAAGAPAPRPPASARRRRGSARPRRRRRRSRAAERRGRPAARPSAGGAAAAAPRRRAPPAPAAGEPAAPSPRLLRRRRPAERREPAPAN